MTSAVEISGTRRRLPALSLLLLAVLITGCGRGARIIPGELRKPIDRSVLDAPPEFDVERFVESLTAPTAMAFDTEKNLLLVAESGMDGREPRILGFSLTDGKTTKIYPQGKVFGPFRSIPFHMYGPIGGMAVHNGTIYVSHRDRDDFGVISALGYDGKGKTVIAGLPAQGDYGVTDLAFRPSDGRLFFGIGSATNSGVVGLDNWDAGWVQRHPKFCDQVWAPESSIRLLGSRFFTNNPKAGLFSGTELAITAPYQPFGEFTRSRIAGARDNKANAAVYSIDPKGGVAAPDFRLEAHGIRNPAGLVFGPNDQFYVSNQGMERRGTRPVNDDPNAVLHIPIGAPRWWGFPDFSADLRPVTDGRFQPDDPQALRRTGYTEVNPLFEHNQRGPNGETMLTAPDDTDRENYVRAIIPPLSGAAKMTFLPTDGAFGIYRGRQLIVALSGDHAPYATGGKPLKAPLGYKVVRVDDVEGDAKSVKDFVHNVAGVPRHMARNGGTADMLERPIDVKMGPDGNLYILDLGYLDPHGGKSHIRGGTGQIFRVLPSGKSGPPTTSPAPPIDQ